MLELQNLSFKVSADDGEKTIIDNVSLDFPDGRLIVVTGPNGGGKSTLARLVAGIERPTSGRILLDGEDITGLGITERARRGIGFAFQQPVKFKGITVLDLMRLAARRPLTASEACEYLSSVGLCARNYVTREVNSSLSGGELKRIEIATVFAKGGKLSIFDEPEAGIDLWSFQNLIQVFKTMRKAVAGGTIVIISHQERILNIADEIIVIESGAVAGRGVRAAMLPKLIGTGIASASCGCPHFGNDAACGAED